MITEFPLIRPFTRDVLRMRLNFVASILWTHAHRVRTLNDEIRWRQYRIAP